MKKELTPELEQALAALVGVVGGNEFHVNRPYICDNCQDDSKEAFPYGVKDRTGKHWDDLCNDCYTILGCKYPSEEESGEFNEMLASLFCECGGQYEHVDTQDNGDGTYEDSYQCDTCETWCIVTWHKEDARGGSRR